MSRKESKFQRELKEELRRIFPGCEIFKTDCNDLAGRPDLIILYQNKWATLEVKANAKAHRQPNQDTWVDIHNRMSYSAFIFPENKEVILDELRHHFKSSS